MATKTKTKAMKAALASLYSGMRDVQTVDVSVNFDDSVLLVDFFLNIRENGDLKLSLGLESASNGGGVRLSEGGRASVWFIQNGQEAAVTLTASLTKRVVSLLEGRDFRTEFGEKAGEEALKAALPVIGSRNYGRHRESGAWLIY